MSTQTANYQQLSLSAREAEQYNMSIRLSSDGLLFVLTPEPSTAVEGASYRECIQYPSAPLSLEDKVEECLFAHESFLHPYHATKVYYEPHCGVLIPHDLYSSRNDDATDWLTSLTSQGEQDTVEELCLTYRWDDEDKTFVSRYSRRLHSLLVRTLCSAEFVPYFAPYLTAQKQLSRQSEHRQLCVFVRESALDVCALEGGDISFINSFAFVRREDVEACKGELLYYIASIWKMLDLDSSTDKLLLIDATLRANSAVISAILSDQTELSKRIKTIERDTLY